MVGFPKLATSVEVIDGDTIKASIDLGFQVTRHQTLHLARVDAPESKTREGRRARDFLTRALHEAKTIVLTTERIDLHGRYVAHIFTSKSAIPILTCFEPGTHPTPPSSKKATRSINPEHEVFGSTPARPTIWPQKHAASSRSHPKSAPS